MVDIPTTFHQFLKQKFSDFFEGTEGRGDVYSSSQLALRLSQDRNGYKSIEINAVIDPNKWYDVDRVSAYALKNDRHLEGTDFEFKYNFVMQQYAQILELFDRKNYPVTAQQLENLGYKRAEILFGYKGKRD